MYFKTCGSIDGYVEDYQKAGLTENSIVAIQLHLGNSLYDSDNETIIRYPDVTIGGVGFGMPEDTTVPAKSDDYIMEPSSNYVYSKNKITNISIRSQINEDVLNGKYAPKFKIEPLPDGFIPETIDIGMTKEEIIASLGQDYEEDTFEDEMDGGTYTSLKYDGVFITVDEYDGKVTYICIDTNKVKGNFNVNVGDSALSALKYCEENYEKVENPHGLEGEYCFGIYEFRDGISFNLQFNKYGNINSIDDVKEDTVVQEIIIFNTGYIGGV